MRIFSYILVAVGILLLANAGYDELRGKTAAPSAGSASGLYYHGTLTRAGNPADFHNAMTYHWFFALMILGAGFVAMLINRGQDKADPMAGDSDQNIDAELKQDELDEQTRNEGGVVEQKQRPPES